MLHVTCVCFSEPERGWSRSQASKQPPKLTGQCGARLGLPQLYLGNLYPWNQGS